MTSGLGAYLRLSYDRHGESLSIDRQLEDCDTLCLRRGENILDKYVDYQKSAYDKRTRRDGFERLLVDLTEGRLTGLVAYDLDRLVRQPKDLERLIDVYDARPSLVFLLWSGELDLTTGDGRAMARVLVTMANKSSMDTARRVMRQKLQRAQLGLSNGPHRPFGWKADRKSMDPKESELIRDAVEKILSGVSIYRILREWDRLNVKSPRGNSWSQTAFMGMLRSPRLAGWAIYRGEIARDMQGEKVRGQWEPILDNETWEQLQVAITPKVGRVEHPAARKYLLSGLVFCSECQYRMSGQPNGKRSYAYVCMISKGACGKTAASGPQLDELVSELVLRKHAATESSPSEQDSGWPGEENLRDVEKRISELMAAYRARVLAAEDVFPTVQALRDEAEALKVERGIFEGNSRVVQLGNLAERWPDMTTEDRRDVLSAALRGVWVSSAGKKRQRVLDVGRIAPVWR